MSRIGNNHNDCRGVSRKANCGGGGGNEMVLIASSTTATMMMTAVTNPPTLLRSEPKANCVDGVAIRNVMRVSRKAFPPQQSTMMERVSRQAKELTT